MNARGTYGNGTRYGRGVHVGLKVFHTVGDSERAVDSIDTEMQAIVDAAYRAMGIDPSTVRHSTRTVAEYMKWAQDFAKSSREERLAWLTRVADAKDKAKLSPLWVFWDSVISPVYGEWMRFREKNNYYNLFTSWEEYEQWLARARQLRAKVEEKGIHIETPPPLDLTSTLPAKIIDAAGEAAKDMGKILKYAIYGGLGLVGVIALSSVVSHTRKGSDPMERYTELHRNTRKDGG